MCYLVTFIRKCVLPYCDIIRKTSACVLNILTDQLRMEKKLLMIRRLEDWLVLFFLLIRIYFRP